MTKKIDPSIKMCWKAGMSQTAQACLWYLRLDDVHKARVFFRRIERRRGSWGAKAETEILRGMTRDGAWYGARMLYEMMERADQYRVRLWHTESDLAAARKRAETAETALQQCKTAYTGWKTAAESWQKRAIAAEARAAEWEKRAVFARAMEDGLVKECNELRDRAVTAAAWEKRAIAAEAELAAWKKQALAAEAQIAEAQAARPWWRKLFDKKGPVVGATGPAQNEHTAETVRG